MTERDLFIAALHKDDPAQRQAYLDEACAGQPELRKQVEDLLRLYDGAGSFLQKPAAASAATGALQDAALQPLPSEIAGTVIGPYKLLQQIGEGGMGVVWMAEQTQPVKRKVALKVIKPGMDSRQVVARFEAERQALALMDHVNIARVFDGGATDTGRPYFVMELVYGVPITRYCDDNQLTPRERLELFVPVCQAIQHAHQKGIIHRDVKPSNVLVTLYDGRPVPKVIDFGVAKATEQRLTERTLFTQYGTMVGTLEYMSPEQAEMSALGVDTRSDIYSLGVLLYELLTGSTPLTHKRMKEAAYAEILRMIKEEEPPRPSTRLSDSGEALASISANRQTEPAKLTKLVRGELDWIVMKPLEKDRNRRYETATGFAADVQRYLNDETVQACPPSVGYRFRKFARRNRTAVATASVVALVVLLAVGAVASSIGWASRDRAARAAALEHGVGIALRDAEQLVEAQKWPEAMAALRRAEGLAAAGAGDEALGRRVRELKADLEMVARLEDIRLRLSQPKVSLTPDGKVEKIGFDFDGTARAYADAFRDYGIDVAALDPREAADRVRARPVSAALVAALDSWAILRWAERGPLLEVARLVDTDELRQRLRGALKDPRTGVRLLEELAAGDEVIMTPASAQFLASALREQGNLALAAAVYTRAQRRHPGDFWTNYYLGYFYLHHSKPARPELAVRYFTAAAALRPGSATVHQQLGQALLEQKDYDGAAAAFRAALRLMPDNVSARHYLGFALKEKGLLDEAIAEFRQVVRLMPGKFKAHRTLGYALSSKGLLDAAIDEFREAIRLKPDEPRSWDLLAGELWDKGRLEEAAAAARESIRLNPNGAEGHKGLAHVLFLQKLLDQALEEARTAVRLDRGLATAHIVLGEVCSARGDYTGAVAALEEAVALRKAQLGPDHRDTQASMHNLAACYNALGRYAEAVKLGEETLALQKANLGPEHPDTVMGMNNLAKDYLALGRPADALKLQEEAMALQKAKLGPEHPDTLRYIHNLAAIYTQTGRPVEALSLLQRALSLQKVKPGPDHPDTLRSMRNLANTYRKLRRPAEALKLDEETLELSKARLGPDHPDTLGSMMGLVNSYAALGRHTEAVKLGEETLARQKARLGPEHRDTVMSTYNLANSYAALGLHADGLEYARETTRLNPRSGYAWQILGWAQYRAGDLRESIATLEKSCKLQKGGVGDCGQWIVLALAHAKLAAQEGLPEQERACHQVEARRWYGQAVKQIDKWASRPSSATGQAIWDFRAEAAKLLGAKEEK